MPVYSKTMANHCWPLIWGCIKWTDMQSETALMQEPQASMGRELTMSSLLVYRATLKASPALRNSAACVLCWESLKRWLTSGGLGGDDSYSCSSCTSGCWLVWSNEQNSEKQHLATVHKQLRKKHRVVIKYSVTKQLQDLGHTQGISNHTRNNIGDNIRHILSWKPKHSLIWNNFRLQLTLAHENDLAETKPQCLNVSFTRASKICLVFISRRKPWLSHLHWEKKKKLTNNNYREIISLHTVTPFFLQ